MTFSRGRSWLWSQIDQRLVGVALGKLLNFFESLYYHHRSMMIIMECLPSRVKLDDTEKHLAGGLAQAGLGFKSSALSFFLSFFLSFLPSFCLFRAVPATYGSSRVR